MSVNKIYRYFPSKIILRDIVSRISPEIIRKSIDDYYYGFFPAHFPSRFSMIPTLFTAECNTANIQSITHLYNKNTYSLKHRLKITKLFT